MAGHCPSGEVWDGGICRPACPPGEVWQGGLCFPAGTRFSSAASLVPLPVTVVGGSSAAFHNGGHFELGLDAACRLFGVGCPPGPSGPGINSGCPPAMSRDPITGECRFDIDPGAGTGFPGGGAAAGAGLTRPTQRSISRLECPVFPNGKTGILWMNSVSGDVVCLPRGTNGSGFGLVRKNKPKAKAFLTAAERKAIEVPAALQKKIKALAGKAGFSCETKASAAGRRARAHAGR